MFDIDKDVLIGGLIVFCIVAFLLLPLAFIWALNTLFNIGIGYTFKTWLAMLLVSALVSGGKVGKNSGK